MADQNKVNNRSILFAGDVDVQYVNILSNNGLVLNVINQMSSIEIYEDIFSPVISGQITLMESFNFIEKMPFLGEEFLEFKIKTPEMADAPGKTLEGQFYIYKITNREVVGDRKLFYVLHFISNEAVVDANIKLSKVYSGKISDVVKSLVSDEGLATQKSFDNIQKTRNDVKYISNYWTPLQNIQYCTKRAVSENLAADYLFFENHGWGFNFLSLEFLYGQNVFFNYIFDDYSKTFPSNSGLTDIASDFKRIRTLSIDEGFDYLKRSQEGFYGSKMISHDLITKKYSVQNFSYATATDFNKQHHLNTFPVFSDKLIHRNNSLIINHPKYYGNFNNIGWDHSNYWAQKRIAQMGQANATSVKMVVPGRTDITAGMKVYLSISSTQAIDKSDHDWRNIQDKMYSGNYLISAINHEITRERHSMNIECIKDSLIYEVQKR